MFTILNLNRQTVIRTLLALLWVVAVCVVVPAGATANTAAKEKVFKQTGKELLDVGQEQYRRGQLDKAQITLMRAAKYKEYLDAEDAAVLNELLSAVSAAGELQNETLEKIEKAKQSAAAVSAGTVVELPPVSANTAAVSEIQSSSAVVSETNVPPVPSAPAVGLNTAGYAEPKVAGAEPPAPPQASYLDVVRQKQQIQQSYTRAIVDDAVAKAKQYSDANDFAMARAAISRASGLVEGNKLLLGDVLYSEYSNKLDSILKNLEQTEIAFAAKKAQQAQIEAAQVQKNLRAQQDADRAKRIEDLMNNAVAYQQQQQYEQALGQLEMLLAIDKTNKQAIVMKQTLEDLINFRRQLELQKEIDRADLDTLYEIDKATIAHSEDITYPKNWKEIVARNKERMQEGYSPADSATYKQLEEIVDLTALTPETTFEQAIEIVRTSIEPPLKLSVRWRDLSDNAFVERDTPIGWQGIEGIALGKALEELLKSVSGGLADIGYAVQEGIVTVASRASLPDRMVARVYDISRIIAPPAQFTADLTTGEDATQGDTGQTDISELEGAQIDWIRELIINSIDPETWFENGGQGTIALPGDQSVQNQRATKIVIRQTPEVHKKIKDLIKDLEESLGEQVSIEARFLFVTENFLEDIGMDFNIFLGQQGNLSPIVFNQNSDQTTLTKPTIVPGSNFAGNALSFGGLYNTPILDDLAVEFLIRATEAHRDTRSLTAPKVTILNNERAYIRVNKERAYIEDWDFQEVTSNGENPIAIVTADPQIEQVTDGVVLNVKPTISPDKNYVLLEISTSYSQANLDTTFNVFDQAGKEHPITFPSIEYATVQTRVNVPRGGTLLIGGQKLAGEINVESGVPGVSKVPLLGRLFSNRSKVKDSNILLILVRPNIILQDDAENEAFAPVN